MTATPRDRARFEAGARPVPSAHALELVVREELGREFGVLDVPYPGERRRLLVELMHDHLSGEPGLLPALTAGADDSVRQVYQLRMSRVVALVAPAMPGPPEEQARRAWAAAATVVGALSIARALPPGAHREAVLRAALRSVEDSLDL